MNLPEAFITMFRESFGDAACTALQASMNTFPTRAIRLNPKRPVNANLKSVLLHPVPWTNDAYFIDHDAKIGSDPLHVGGEFYIQEPSAMAPVTALQPSRGERILDLCAAPGGKTTQIAAAMQDTGVLVANEIHRDRCLTLAENTERMGLTQTCVTNLEPNVLVKHFKEFFDAILVDAPCSGEGMFRKDHTAIEEWHEHLPLRNAIRQLDILESAYRMTKPGGRLVYSTCTFNPFENEIVLAQFLMNHADLRIVPINLPQAQPGLTLEKLRSLRRLDVFAEGEFADRLKTVEDDQIKTEHAARYFPYSSPCEGHFIARIEKNIQPIQFTQLDTHHRKAKRKQNERNMCQTRGFPSFYTFMSTALQPHYIDQLLTTHDLQVEGEILYAIPKLLALVKTPTRGILRKGLPLGTFRGQRFLPTHTFALALNVDDVLCEWRLHYGDERIITYLHGETIAVSASDGFLLVTIEGVPLGWGKVVQGTLKNHFPKGLRKKYTFALSKTEKT